MRKIIMIKVIFHLFYHFIWKFHKFTISLHRIQILKDMTKDEQKLYWLELAEYDLDTAQAMYDTKRWLYVGFMCHQVLEKSMKAFWCATKPEDPPYSHNLMSLYQSTELSKIMSQEQVLFISQIMPMNIEARYPSFKERLFHSLTPEYCKQMLDNTKDFFQWIKSKL